MSNSPGADEPAGKDRKRSAHWSESDTKILIGVLLAHRETGRTADNGFKPEVWNEAAAMLQQQTQLGGPKTPEACKSRWQRLQREFKAAKEAESHLGFSWDSSTHRITASTEAWETLDKPDAHKYQKIHLPCYNELALLCPPEPRLKPRGKLRPSMGSLSDSSMLSLSIPAQTSAQASAPQSTATGSQPSHNGTVGNGLPDGTPMMDASGMHQHQHQHHHAPSNQHQYQQHQQQPHHHHHQVTPTLSHAHVGPNGAGVGLGVVNGVSSMGGLVGMAGEQGHGLHMGPNGHEQDGQGHQHHNHAHAHGQHSRAPSGQAIHLGHLGQDAGMINWGDKTADDTGESDYDTSFGLGSFTMRGPPQQAIHNLLGQQGHPTAPSSPHDLAPPPAKRMRTSSGSGPGPGGGGGNVNGGGGGGNGPRSSLPHTTPASQPTQSSSTLPTHAPVPTNASAAGLYTLAIDHSGSSRSLFPLLDVQNQSMYAPLGLDSLATPNTGAPGASAPGSATATPSGPSRFPHSTQVGGGGGGGSVPQAPSTPTAELTIASMSDSQRRTEAITRLEREDLSQDEMVRCLREFEKNIAAVDTYLAIRGQGLRAAWLRSVVERDQTV